MCLLAFAFTIVFVWTGPQWTAFRDCRLISQQVDLLVYVNNLVLIIYLFIHSKCFFFSISEKMFPRVSSFSWTRNSLFVQDRAVPWSNMLLFVPG